MGLLDVPSFVNFNDDDDKQTGKYLSEKIKFKLLQFYCVTR